MPTTIVTSYNKMISLTTTDVTSYKILVIPVTTDDQSTTDDTSYMC